MYQKRVSRSEAMNMVQSNYKIEFEKAAGYSIYDNESLDFATNPYINKRDLFDNKDIFLLLNHAEVDQIDDEYPETVSQAKASNDDKSNNSHTKQDTTSSGQEPRVNDQTNHPQTQTDHQIHPNSSNLNTHPTNTLQALRNNAAFNNMSKADQKAAFRSRVTLNRIAANRRKIADQIYPGMGNRPSKKTKLSADNLTQSGTEYLPHYTNVNSLVTNNTNSLSNNSNSLSNNTHT
ncbi:hypothetical protein QAD02_007205 [Eretmocerus hayati]|uniref:Uncharacterized protein n=1 Tax=Eretmocerus hayati TaxID=131215 RepID=A0ACC2N322_9HYME|nr:hypothetical protein QAD02_007205 [Eretmocerus hayati]